MAKKGKRTIWIVIGFAVAGLGIWWLMTKGKNALSSPSAEVKPKSEPSPWYTV